MLFPYNGYAMNGEFNDLTTYNTATTFSPNTNNIATSDELSADPNYVRKMGTAYSAGKWVKRVVVITGITLTISAAAILGGNYITNVYIGKVPVLATGTVFELEQDSLKYQFTLESNANNYPVTFKVYDDKTTVFTMDCTEVKEYIGSVDSLGYGKDITYEIYFTNRLDYRKSLIKRTLTIPEE